VSGLAGSLGGTRANGACSLAQRERQSAKWWQQRRQLWAPPTADTAAASRRRLVANSRPAPGARLGHNSSWTPSMWRHTLSGQQRDTVARPPRCPAAAFQIKSGAAAGKPTGESGRSAAGHSHSSALTHPPANRRPRWVIARANVQVSACTGASRNGWPPLGS